MNHWPFHIGDFNNATRHSTPIEKLMYVELLNLYYDKEKPLINDLAFLEKKTLAHSDEQKQAVKTILNDFFFLENDVWRNNRCDSVIESFQKREKELAEIKNNQNERQRQSREKRAKLFAELRELGISMPFDSTISDIEKALVTVTSQQHHAIATAKPEPKPKPKPENNSSISLNNEEMPKSSIVNSQGVFFEQVETLFAQFWLSGIRKGNKNKSKSIFIKIMLAMKVPEQRQVFTQMLVDDIKKRIEVQQFGFDAMLPTTYLNGERWNDEIKLLPKKLLSLPLDDSKLWDFAKLHKLPNPARMTYFEYRMTLKNYIETNKLTEGSI